MKQFGAFKICKDLDYCRLVCTLSLILSVFSCIGIYLIWSKLNEKQKNDNKQSTIKQKTNEVPVICHKTLDNKLDCRFNDSIRYNLI